MSHLAQADSPSRGYEQNMDLNSAGTTVAGKQLPNIPVSTEKELIPVSNHPSSTTPAQKTDSEGYEWYTNDDGVNYYRTVGSSDEWVKFEN